MGGEVGDGEVVEDLGVVVKCVGVVFGGIVGGWWCTYNPMSTAICNTQCRDVPLMPLVILDRSPPKIGSRSRSLPGAEDWSCATTSWFVGTSTCIVRGGREGGKGEGEGKEEETIT